MNLNQVTLPSVDVERSSAFYRRLGFTQIVEAESRYARFECPGGGSTFSLHRVQAMPVGQGAVVYFECRDLDARCESLRRVGVQFESMPEDRSWLWREARLRDPDGNEICLYWAGENRRFPPWRIGGAAAALSTTLPGTWRLLSREDRTASGEKRVEPSLGEDPVALLIYDRAGHFAAQFMKRDRSTSSGAAGCAAGANNSRAIGGYDAYFGTYTVNDADGTVTQRLTGSLAPENVGIVLTRAMQVRNDRLVILLQTTLQGETVTRTLTWERVG